MYTGAGATPSVPSSPEQNSKTSFNKCTGQRVQRYFIIAKCFSAVDMSDTSNPCLFVVLFQKASLQILLPVRPIGGCAAYGL